MVLEIFKGSRILLVEAPFEILNKIMSSAAIREIMENESPLVKYTTLEKKTLVLYILILDSSF